MEKSSHIAWKLVPLRHNFPLKVVPLIEVPVDPINNTDASFANQDSTSCKIVKESDSYSELEEITPRCYVICFQAAMCGFSVELPPLTCSSFNYCHP
jgi:hypothetical protein